MKSREGIKQKYDRFSDDHPYAASMGETALLFGLRFTLEKASDLIGVPVGHGRKDNPKRNKFIEEHPALAVGAVTAWAPISEEFVFRELPARILEKKGYDNDSLTSKRAKLAVAGIFAAAHGGSDAIPLPQFIGGLNYKRIHEKRGLGASVVAHSTNNALAAAQHIVKKKRSKAGSGFDS